MNTVNVIEIVSPYAPLFERAADIARWPVILPHYRWVRVLERRPDGIVVAEMAARHLCLPLWWRTIQTPRRQERRIGFRHIGGVTQGMEVEWRFERLPGSPERWQVEIHHAFRPPWGPLRPLLADAIVGGIFVKQVANKTLRRIKALTEQASAGA